MSIYLDGLAFAAHLTLWLLGALTPVVLALALIAGLSGPLSRAQRQTHAWVTARRLRREAAYGMRPEA
jgi:uncharacterized BrkB/YihY/UPF0761 family membrane protein